MYFFRCIEKLIPLIIYDTSMSQPVADATKKVHKGEVSIYGYNMQSNYDGNSAFHREIPLTWKKPIGFIGLYFIGADRGRDVCLLRQNGSYRTSSNIKSVDGLCAVFDVNWLCRSALQLGFGAVKRAGRKSRTIYWLRVKLNMENFINRTL